MGLSFTAQSWVSETGSLTVLLRQHPLNLCCRSTRGEDSWQGHAMCLHTLCSILAQIWLLAGAHTHRGSRAQDRVASYVWVWCGDMCRSAHELEHARSCPH